MFAFLVCLVLAAVSVDASVVLGLPGLYNNYHGEYAAVYDNYEPRPYAFEYGVSDAHTGDHKTQWETKDKAGVVRGSYSLLEPDGSTRIVDYIADDHGFRAIVKKIGIHGQSVESHGGAVESAGLVQPIVVADFEPVPVHAEEPIHVAQPLPIEQQLHLQQPVRVPQSVYVEQAPVFQSYDGGVEHYQNLFQRQQPYNLQYPNAENLYVETPKHDFGNYVPYIPQQELNQANYVQQVPPTFKQDIRLPESHAAPAPALTAPLPVAPNADVYYSQITEFGEPQGKSVVTFQQPQQVILQENQAGPVGVEHNTVSNQIQQQATVHNERPIKTYNTQLPVESYQLEQNFPGGNHILVQNPGYGYIPEQGLQSHSVQGVTGNLRDDSAYTNYARSDNIPLVLNEGERLPQSSKYGQIW